MVTMGMAKVFLRSSVYSYCFHLVVVAGVQVFVFLEEEFGIQAEYESRINAVTSFGSDFRCCIVQGVDTVEEHVQLPFRDMFPFILYGVQNKSVYVKLYITSLTMMSMSV